MRSFNCVIKKKYKLNLKNSPMKNSIIQIIKLLTFAQAAEVDSASLVATSSNESQINEKTIKISEHFITNIADHIYDELTSKGVNFSSGEFTGTVVDPQTIEDEKLEELFFKLKKLPTPGIKAILLKKLELKGVRKTSDGDVNSDLEGSILKLIKSKGNIFGNNGIKFSGLIDCIFKELKQKNIPSKIQKILVD